jgi:hypothetical protein
METWNWEIISEEPNGRDVAHQITGLDDEGVDYMVRKLRLEDIDRIADAIKRRPEMLAAQLREPTP